jgi:2-amino-4-hydroxy-6-hydroxymethyldihydropteridine diphosphokinase
MKNIFLGLGSNLGERKETLQKAKIRIEEVIGTVVSASSIYETEPWGFKSENDFLNMVMSVKTELSPSGLVGRILMIESQMGRTRGDAGYTSRNIDIDILLYDNEIVKEGALIIPHPKMHDRRFVLIPLAEIAPDLIHPVFSMSIASLLKSCKDKSKVRKFRY